MLHPPIEDRSKLLYRYYDDMRNMDTITSLIRYKQAMHYLYKEYNPWMKSVKITLDNWEYH
jgi:hypothetical protein